MVKVCHSIGNSGVVLCCAAYYHQTKSSAEMRDYRFCSSIYLSCGYEYADYTKYKMVCKYLHTGIAVSFRFVHASLYAFDQKNRCDVHYLNRLCACRYILYDDRVLCQKIQTAAYGIYMVCACSGILCRVRCGLDNDSKIVKSFCYKKTSAYLKKTVDKS